MAQTKINGLEQIKLNSISSALVDSSIIIADGTYAFTADQSMGGHKLTNLANGVATTDAVTLGQLQAYLQGLSPLLSVQAMTTGSETYTISSGSVTQISGTTVDGISFSIGDRILVKNAPAASGSGVADSSNAGSAQPANGVYTITGNTTNLTLARDSTSETPMSGSVNPAGKFVYSEAGTANPAGVGYIVISPATPDTAFTWGTTNLQFGKLSGGAGGSVTNVSIASANGFAGTVLNASSTPQLTLTTTITGVLKGNGTAITAATAGTDYLTPGNWSFNETPSGLVNGSNTSFTLANSPLNSGASLLLFLNGMLLEGGVGDDYTVSGSSITMLFAPGNNDKLRATYLHS